MTKFFSQDRVCFPDSGKKEANFLLIRYGIFISRWEKEVIMRNRFFLTIVIATFFFVAAGVGVAVCGDQEDGIATDDNITSYDDLGDSNQNINFIKLNAKSSAKQREKSVKKGTKTDDVSGKNGSGSMNSVLMGPGSNVKGDIIIIDESKGDKTQVVE
jgi:hypothetical protein